MVRKVPPDSSTIVRKYSKKLKALLPPHANDELLAELKEARRNAAGRCGAQRVRLRKFLRKMTNDNGRPNGPCPVPKGRVGFQFDAGINLARTEVHPTASRCRQSPSLLFALSLAASLASHFSGSSLNAAAQPEQQTGYDLPLYVTDIDPSPPEMMHLGPGLSLSATANDVPSLC